MAKFLQLISGVPRMVEVTDPVIYDEGVAVEAPVSAGTNISLPGGQTYTSEELEVYLNGTRLESVLDYTYVGSPPRTQIQFTFDLVDGDYYRFRIDRTA
jgi:hypothetical protein